MLQLRSVLLVVVCVAVLVATIARVDGDEVHRHDHAHEGHHHGHESYEGDEANELEHEHFGENGEHDEEFDHEAVIGSKREAELFHSYTIEEAKQRLAEIVQRIDTNHDGVVNDLELRAWLKQNLRKLDMETAQEDFVKYTAGGSSLNWADYIKGQYSYSVEEIDKFAAQPTDETRHFVQSVADDRTRWNAADVNKDGELDLQEFVAFLSPYNYEHMQSYEVDRVLGQFDDSADGVIDLREFEAHETDDVLDEEARISIAEQFRELDKNSDGRLERTEVRDWVAPGLDDSAELEARHLFEMTNTDANENELTLSEILDHHELWVGSQGSAQMGDYLDADDDGADDLYDDEEAHTEL